MSVRRSQLSYHLILLITLALLGLGCGNSNDFGQPTGQSGGGIVPRGDGTAVVTVNFGQAAANREVRGRFFFPPEKIFLISTLEYKVFDVATRRQEGPGGTLTVTQAMKLASQAEVTIPNLTPGEKIVVMTVRLSNGEVFWEQIEGVRVNANSTVRASDQDVIPVPGEPPASPFTGGGGGDDGGGDDGGGGDGGGGDGGNTDPLATLYTNYGSAGTGTANIGVLQVAADGTFSQSSSATATAPPASIEKVNGTVFVALNGIDNRIEAYTANSQTGALTFASSTANGVFGDVTNNIYDLDSANGSGNLLVALSAFTNRLFVFQIGADGHTLTEVDSTQLQGADYRNVEYYDAPGSKDFLYLSGAASGDNKILAYSLDTTSGELGSVPDSPFPNPFRRPGAMDSADGRLFVAETGVLEGDPDAVYWYNINNTTGALSINSNVALVGEGPAAVKVINNLVYIANANDGDITKYQIGTSMLTNGASIASGLTFPHALLATGVGNETQLFVAGSSSVKRFVVNTTSGALTVPSNAEVTGLPSPGALTR